MSRFEMKHKQADKLSEHIAYRITQFLKFTLNLFYGRKYAKRAMILETIAAVPGMVAGMFHHLKALRRMKDDEGWIRELLDEAENERMHLMIFLNIAKPSWIERVLVLLAQGGFIAFYGLVYLCSSRIAHRLVGYFEEEACNSYTDYIAQVESGQVDNIAAPQIAIDYYGLNSDARLLEVLYRIREDEGKHRDRNHQFAEAYEKRNLPAHLL